MNTNKAAFMMLMVGLLAPSTGCAPLLTAVMGAQAGDAIEKASKESDMPVLKEACARSTYKRTTRLTKEDKQKACDALRKDYEAKVAANDMKAVSEVCETARIHGALRVTKEEKDAACIKVSVALSAKIKEGDCDSAAKIWDVVGRKSYKGFGQVHTAMGEKAVECKSWPLIFDKLTRIRTVAYDGPKLMKHLQTKFADNTEFQKQWGYRYDVVQVIAAPVSEPSDARAIDKLLKEGPSTLCKQIEKFPSEDAKYYMSLYFRWHFKTHTMDEGRRNRFKASYEKSLLKIEEDYTYLNEAECTKAVASYLYIKGFSTRAMHKSVKKQRSVVSQEKADACLKALGTTPKFAKKKKAMTTKKDFNTDYFQRYHDYKRDFEKHYASCFEAVTGTVQGGGQCSEDFECKDRSKMCFSMVMNKPSKCTK